MEFIKAVAVDSLADPGRELLELDDRVVVLIHVIYFGLLIWAWHWWQHRGDQPTGTAIETSSYGRPLVKKS